MKMNNVLSGLICFVNFRDINLTLCLHCEVTNRILSCLHFINILSSLIFFLSQFSVMQNQNTPTNILFWIYTKQQQPFVYVFWHVNRKTKVLLCCPFLILEGHLNSADASGCQKSEWTPGCGCCEWQHCQNKGTMPVSFETMIWCTVWYSKQK